MSTETAVLESSATPEVVAPATPEMDVSRGALVDLTPEQRKEYKTTGNLPTPKTEVSETSSAQGESGTPEKQVAPKVEPKPKATAEERIAQLESTIERIRKGSGLEKPKAETSGPAKPVVQHPAISQKPTSEDKNEDGTFKYGTHEEFTEALLDWKWEKKKADDALASQQNAQSEALNANMEKARSRYENLDGVLEQTVKTIVEDVAISPVIKQMLYDSDVSPDLVFTIGSNPAELASFVKMSRESPGKAIRYIAITESLIAQELESKTAPVVVEPATPRTQAPKPPAEAGGRAATPPDSMQAALEASGGKLNPSLKAEFLRRELAKLK